MSIFVGIRISHAFRSLMGTLELNLELSELNEAFEASNESKGQKYPPRPWHCKAPKTEDQMQRGPSTRSQVSLKRTGCSNLFESIEPRRHKWRRSPLDGQYYK